MLSSAARSMFYQVTSSPSRGVCHNLRKVGGTWVQKVRNTNETRLIYYYVTANWVDFGCFLQLCCTCNVYLVNVKQ